MEKVEPSTSSWDENAQSAEKYEIQLDVLEEKYGIISNVAEDEQHEFTIRKHAQMVDNNTQLKVEKVRSLSKLYPSTR